LPATQRAIVASSHSPEPSAPFIHPLSLHDALPICSRADLLQHPGRQQLADLVAAESEDAFADLDRVLANQWRRAGVIAGGRAERSEEHTSELQSQSNLVCRLLLEKKNTNVQMPFVF